MMFDGLISLTVFRIIHILCMNELSLFLCVYHILNKQNVSGINLRKDLFIGEKQSILLLTFNNN